MAVCGKLAYSERIAEEQSMKYKEYRFTRANHEGLCMLCKDRELDLACG